MFKKLEKIWSNVKHINIISDDDLLNFQNINKVILPVDFINYFKLFNGTNNKYDDNFFLFNSLNELKRIDVVSKNFTGTPNHTSILSTLDDYEHYYVFADYHIGLYLYAIRLNENRNEENDIIVICEDEFRKISNTFSDFLALYIDDSHELYI